MWIPAVMKEMNNNLLVSEATDGRLLGRHSNHVRLRHADARDDRVQDVAAPDEIHQPPDRNVVSEDETPVPGGDNNVNSPAAQSPAVRRSGRIRKAPDRFSL